MTDNSCNSSKKTYQDSSASSEKKICLARMRAEEELEKEAAEANIVKEEVLKPKENPMNFLEETGSVEYQEQGAEVYYYKEEEEGDVKAEQP